jgi:transcriptional regulator with XRE-family HTH domain
MHAGNMTLTQEFGKRLRFVREMREMTQQQLGRAAGIDQTVIAHMEAGRRSPALQNLKQICKAATVSADYLLGLSTRVER